MTPLEYFEQAKAAHVIPSDAKLQASYQYGVEADKLAHLVLTGTKTATTSALDLYEPDEPLPIKNAYDVILDGNDDPVCIIQNDDVKICNYLDVSEKHAYQEGEGDRTLNYWKKVHQDFFVKEYQEMGQQFESEAAKMVLETFHVVYPINC